MVLPGKRAEQEVEVWLSQGLALVSFLPLGALKHGSEHECRHHTSPLDIPLACTQVVEVSDHWLPDIRSHGSEQECLLDQRYPAWKSLPSSSQEWRMSQALDSWPLRSNLLLSQMGYPNLRVPYQKWPTSSYHLSQKFIKVTTGAYPFKV